MTRCHTLGLPQIGAVYVLLAAVSLATGNLIFPLFLLGFLRLSRPVEAPDVAALVAAILANGVVGPLIQSVTGELPVDVGGMDSLVGKAEFLLGLGLAFVVVREVVGEGERTFVEPVRRYRSERRPAVKEEKDMTVFDIRLRQKAPPGEGEGEKEERGKEGVSSGRRKEE
jgi:hypothetical protein